MQIQATRILGIAGSLRQASYNRALLRAARDEAPPGTEIALFDLSAIPLYNADLDTHALRPEPVRRLKAAIEAADAVLFATPEYNYSTPGVLQNAIDWASRPARRSPLAGKPVGVIGASTGAIGTARAQEHLKQVLLATLSYVMPHAGFLVGHVAQKFDAEGRLVDEATRAHLVRYVEDLERWVRRLRAFDEAEAPAADGHR